MLFFKPKYKDEDILPPPPPDMELEEEKPELFDRLIKPKKAQTFPEEQEFDRLVEEVGNLKPKKSEKKERITRKTAAAKKPKALKKELKKKGAAVKMPAKKAPKIKSKGKLTSRIIKKAEIPKAALPRLKKENISDIEIALPKDIGEPRQEIELPDMGDFQIENVEESGIEDSKTEFGTEIEDFGRNAHLEAKPREVAEAEEEIKSAIEKIKEHEKPSFFRRLFAKRENKEESSEGQLKAMPEAGDEVAMIQNSISNAREALMKFDLEAARKNYAELMRIYNKIKPEDKAKVYHEIRDLYFERKSAEELKV